MAQLANLTTTLAIESASFVNGIEQSRGAVRSLIAQLDPAAAAQAKFNRQMDLAERGLKSGQLSADLYEKVVARLKQRLDEATGSGGKLVQTNGQMRSGMQQLGYQLGDISQGFAVGTSAVTIFAQQSGQTIQALQLMTAGSKGFLAFLGGPWGAVLSAALVVATPFVAKLFEGGDALDKEIDKLKKSAEQSRLTDQAKAAFGKTIEGVTVALRENQHALDDEAQSSRSSAERAEIAAQNQLNIASALRATTAARLADARASQAALRAPGNATDASLNSERNVVDSRVTALAASLKATDAAIEAAKQQITQSQALQIAAHSELDIAGKLNKVYDQRVQNAVKEATAIDIVTGALKRKTDGIEAERQVALKAEADKQAELKKTIGLRDQETASLSSVIKLLRQELPGVQIAHTTDGKHVAGSDHYKSQAIDFVPPGGMASISKDEIRAIFEKAGVPIRVNGAGVEQLFGPGDKGHDDHFHVAFEKGKLALDNYNDAAKRAAATQKELDSQLDGLRAKFDPAAKAADDYAEALADIDKLVKAGKLSPDEAALYRAKAYQDEMVAKYPQIVAEGKRAAEAEKKFADEAQRAADAIIKRGANILNDQQAAIGYAQEQLGITTTNNAQRAIELAHLAAIKELERDRIPLESEQGKAILFNAEQLEKLRQAQERVNANMQEFQQFGDQVLGDIFDPNNWTSWGDLGKRVLQDLQQEFIKLAVLNPLKNALLGESNATLSGIGSLFGGGGGGGSGFTDLFKFIPDPGTINHGLPGFATGGSFTFGGKSGIDKNVLSLNGSPIANVSKGETATIGWAGNDNGRQPIVFDMRGAVVTQDLLAQMNVIANQQSVSVVTAAQIGNARRARARYG